MAFLRHKHFLVQVQLKRWMTFSYIPTTKMKKIYRNLLEHLTNTLFGSIADILSQVLYPCFTCLLLTVLAQP